MQRAPGLHPIPLVPAKAGTQCWIPACAGMSGVCCARVLPRAILRFNCQTANAARAGFSRFAPRQAPSPGFLSRRRGPPAFQPPLRSRERNPRARGTPKVLMDPRASTPHSIEACRSPMPAFGSCKRRRGKPQVRQIQRRPARGVYRFAPHSPRWSILSVRVCLLSVTATTSTV